MTTVTKFFDVNNKEHLEAYKHLQKYGAWPKDFFEKIKDLDFEHGAWAIGIANKLADAYLQVRTEFQPIRFELDMFAHAMEAKLKLNDEKKGDSWKTCDNSFLVGKFFGELQEWCDSSKEIDKRDRKELVDIANICLFLWYRDWAKSTRNTSFDISDEVK